MKSSLKFICSTLLSLPLLLSACVADNEPYNDFALEKGDLMPQFSIMLNNGTPITSANLLGAPSMIVFFNTSCPDCRKELPVVNRVVQTTAIRTICIAREENESSIAGFWSAEQLTLPYSPQPDRRVFELFAAQTIPRIFIFNASGIVTAAFSDNPLPTAETLTKAIADAQ